MSGKGINVTELIHAIDFEKLNYLQKAANAVCDALEDKKTFSTYASELNRLVRYADREDLYGHTRKQFEAISAIYGELQKKRKHINNQNFLTHEKYCL